MKKNHGKNNILVHRMNDIFDGFESLSSEIIASSCSNEDETDVNEAASDDENVKTLENQAEDDRASDLSVIRSSVNQVVTHESRDFEIADGKYQGGIALSMKTLLSLAVSNENTCIVKDLLLSGANSKASDVRGWTLLHVTVNNDDLKTAKLLLDAIDLHSQKMSLVSQSEALALATNVHGLPAPHPSLSHIDARDNGGRTPLIIAIRSERTGIALFLFQQGVDIDLKDYYDMSFIFHVLQYNNDKFIHDLFFRKCNLSFVNRDGNTVLHTAASFENKFSLGTLIK